MLYKDSNQAADDRAKDLLGRMSLPEKLAQLRCLDLASLMSVTGGDNPEPDTRSSSQNKTVLAAGIGYIARTSIDGLHSPAQTAEVINRLQQDLMQESRHGIPALVIEPELPGNLAQPYLTAAPSMAVAATFAPTLARELARLQGNQARSLGVRMLFGPVLDLSHAHTNGCLLGGFGDNPYLAARMGVATVRGLQGEMLRDGVAACAGHFVGGDRERRTWPLNIGPRQLRERFAEPFAAAIRDADLAAIQLGSHSIDGLVPSAAPELVLDLLRDELGFEGLIVSDAELLEHLVEPHRLAVDQRQASARAIGSGVDAQLPHSRFFEEPLSQNLEDETTELGLINKAVRRVLLLKFRLGLFDAEPADESVATDYFDPTIQQELMQRLAAQSTVMLCNDGVLPLQPTVAQINPRSSTVTSTTAQRFVLLDCAAISGTLTGLRARLRGHLDIFSFHQSAQLDAGGGQRFFGSVAETVTQADVVLLCLSGGGPLPAAEQIPSADLDERVPAAQMALLQELVATGACVVSLVFDGVCSQLPELVRQSNALLLAWHGPRSPEMVASGEAIVDLLLGVLNPAGRLPLGAATPEFSFGSGLSYSRFEYENLQCPETVDTHGVLRLSFDVTNRSGPAGDEVVQIFVSDQVAQVRRPPQQLVGFNRVRLGPGETVTCKFRIDPSQLAYFDGSMQLAIDPGEVILSVGRSAASPGLRASFRLTGQRRKLSQRQIVATQITEPR